MPSDQATLSIFGVFQWIRKCLDIERGVIPLHERQGIIRNQPVSEELLNTFMLMSQFSAAVYCRSNNDSPGTSLSCSAGNCPLVEAGDTQTVAEFQDTAATDTTGYVAISRKYSMIVVGFRGSRSMRNYIADLTFEGESVNLAGCKNCKGHKGFWNSWQEAKEQVVRAVRQVSAENPGYQIVFTGHSLGAAVATLAAADMRTMGLDISLYTFGAPRVGDSSLSTFISNQPGGNYRLTHGSDLIPQLPPLLFGYRHISPEYFISSGQNIVPTPKDITIYSGDWNLSGNTGKLPGNVVAHQWYFNRIASCASGFEWK
ncbi:alpha/beta-hydrolase [Eremomyces bilateralis CBS 781.70]|uniref:Alpha/beta-hydrolase n=1 Tax=Eremomyces bilateralis CBS 781.70 TaxID=1392243 RepID=A0A6G1FSK6_9PEZI|nr:alpha/beta-hydrolase [Eremomyces bilateralis CBS 781.70]KAF1808669.1 alpha/beta-hydrolase [Eremomyces bilateralis CBS 781.70]